MPKPQKSTEKIFLHPCHASTSAHATCSNSCLQIHSPTASTPNLLSPYSASSSSTRLHPHSATSSTTKLLQPTTNSATSSTTKLSHLNSAESSTSKLLPASANASSSRISLVVPEMHPRWHQGAGPHARGKRRNAGIGDIDEHVFARSVTLTLALLFIIGIPLGAILPQKYVKQLPINVLVPLYIDPTSGGWERLFNAVIKHSETNFTVIVNPSHGPGTAAWPSGIYVEALERLNKFSNVQTVGYIDTERGARSNVTVFKEVETYAGWNQSKIAVSGIFFDRTPFEEWEREGNNTSDEGTAKEYLRNITEAVRHAEGFLRRKVVIHSPGSVPNVNLTSAHADVTVVFEGAYAEIPARGWMREKLVSLGKRREEFAYLVHDVPKGIKRGGVRRIIDGSRRNIEWLFVTNQGGDDRYEEYGDGWEDFLDLTW